MQIMVNGYQYGETKDLNILKQTLLELIDIEFSPLEALKSNMTSFFDLIEAFCKKEKETVIGSHKSKLAREITKNNNQRKYWNMIQSKDAFVKKYYDMILTLYGADILRGFGKSNAFGDFLQGNAETQRLSFKHSD